MPLIYESTYTRRPFLLFNSYLETLYPYFSSPIGEIKYERTQLELKDGDFLELDWVRGKGEKLVIISHGFEGNSRDHFIEKSVQYLTRNGYDILVWHFRGCGGLPNRLARFYHHGDIEDLEEVVHHVTSRNNYTHIGLLGFSMGGTLVINYLGNKDIPSELKYGVCFSTPLDLTSCMRKLDMGFNQLIAKSFFKKLRRKVALKAEIFPDKIFKDWAQIKGLTVLIEKVILPLDGYLSIEEFGKKWSGLNTLAKIKTPLLIVNAKNDPLLSPNCFPYELSKKNEFVYLETPSYGGHIGFSKKVDGEVWYPNRIKLFIDEVTND